VHRSDYIRAEQCYRQALQVAGPVLDLARLGRIYHGLGHCYTSLGDTTRGIDLLSRAVALYAVENDLRPAPARIDLPRVENDLGLMLLRNGQPERAEELFRAALRRLEEVGAERLQSYILLSLAEVRQGQGRVDEAVVLIERALDLAQRLDEHELADQRYHQALAILAEAGMTGARAEYTAAYQKMLDARVDAVPLERSAG
jgi:tetratricopeptide (TPR) repeat protein